MSRRRTLFSKADIRRACEAAPGRTVEIIAPDGTKIRLVPGGEFVQMAATGSARDAADVVAERLK